MTRRNSILDFVTYDELAYEARVEELIREPDWEAILVKFERADLVELIGDLHAAKECWPKLGGMVERWAADKAAWEMANDAE